MLNTLVSVLPYWLMCTIMHAQAYNKNIVNTMNIIRRIIWTLCLCAMYKDPSERGKLLGVGPTLEIRESVFPNGKLALYCPKRQLDTSRASASTVRHNRAMRLTHKACNLNIPP